MNDERAAIIGAGSWGTALALLLANKGIETRLWGHRPEHIKLLHREGQNRAYLPGFRFPASLHPEESLEKTVAGAGVIVMVVPSHAYRQIFSQVGELAQEGAVFVSATKGIENLSLKTMTQVMGDSYHDSDSSPPLFAVLSGPSFAKEVAQKVPTAITIGSERDDTAQFLQNFFSTDYFRVYTSSDVIGLEISAALKNIIAIAAGISDGLAFGANARAALITRGLAEMTRLGIQLGAQQETFFGLSGLGDLVLTCTGELSRNRYVGIELGRGRSLDAILDSMNMVAEGIKTTKSVYDLVTSLGAEMPILEQVYEVLYEGKDCGKAVQDLLSRDLKAESS
ncbi:MAG: NAD(P)-dependent glycerol-3-phosphate dehydrogenase [Desulfofustis sp.]|nr:NAD(P)-dependent glycerol-3-phosphate dehydrogenase [Desulfofustis sp.]